MIRTLAEAARAPARRLDHTFALGKLAREKAQICRTRSTHWLRNHCVARDRSHKRKRESKLELSLETQTQAALISSHVRDARFCLFSAEFDADLRAAVMHYLYNDPVAVQLRLRLEHKP